MNDQSNIENEARSTFRRAIDNFVAGALAHLYERDACTWRVLQLCRGLTFCVRRLKRTRVAETLGTGDVLARCLDARR